MEITGIIAAFVGAAFCFVMAGGVATEHPGADSAEDMHEMFDTSPDAV